VYVSKSEDDPVGVLELALDATVAAEPIEAKIRAAQKAGQVRGRTPEEIAEQARATGVISALEHAQLVRRDELRDKVIRVDDFPADLGYGVHHERPRQRAAA